jgi:CHASE2 domain-containing sensor protein
MDRIVNTAGLNDEPGDDIHAQSTSNVCRRFGHASTFARAYNELLSNFWHFAKAKFGFLGGMTMKHISNLIFAVAFVGMSGFWALALTGHLPAPAPPPPSPR